jgi:polyisoprenyl-phosphate glycosyltransferase
LIYIIAAWVLGSTVPGWTSLMLVVLGLGAVQMFVLGMIGEYLGRLYIEAKKRPLYIVADVIGAAGEGSKLGHRADNMATSETPGGIGTRPTK